MRQYLDLLQDVLDNGTVRDDRTGVGTISVFGRQIRFYMKSRMIISLMQNSQKRNAEQFGLQISTHKVFS